MRRIQFAGVAAIIVFALLTAFMMGRVWNGIQTSSWTTTGGTLQRVNVERMAGETTDEVKVRYTYTVSDHSFAGSRISYRMWDPPSVRVLQRLEGGSVTVFYDPNSPGNAVLFKGTSILDVVFTLIPFLLLCAVGFLMFMFVRHEDFRNRVLLSRSQPSPLQG